MKLLICLASLAAVASASHLVAPLPAAIPAAVNTGSSRQYRSQDNLGQYSFGYDEAGATGGSFRHEKSDAYGNRVGSYGLTDADGRVRIVNYVSDANGYRASVQTNEPGTEPRDSAAVSMNKAPVHAVAVAAPVAAPVAPVAPVALAAPAAPLALPAAPLPLPAALPLAAPVPVYGPAAYGFSAVVDHHHHLAAPLPVALPAPLAAPLAAY